jgi:hypothetical protein
MPKKKDIVLAHSDSGPTPVELPAKQAAFLAEIKTTQKWKEMVARQQRMSRREPLVFAVTDEALPLGVASIVRIGQSKPLTRYAVVPRMAFNDELYMRTLLQVHIYESRNEEDASPVTITLFEDKRVEIDSRAKGKRSYVDESGGQQALHKLTGPLLAEADAAAAIHIPGVGAARIVRIERRSVDEDGIPE